MDTSLNRTPGMVPRVSGLEGSHYRFLWYDYIFDPPRLAPLFSGGNSHRMMTRTKVIVKLKVLKFTYKQEVCIKCMYEEVPWTHSDHIKKQSVNHLLTFNFHFRLS